MSKKQKERLYKIIISGLFIIILKFYVGKLKVNKIIELCLYLIPYLIVGKEILKKGLKKILKRQSFDECVLMSIATIGAFLLGENSEAVFVMLFYQIGEFFQDYTVEKGKKNIASVFDLKPEFANIENESGEIIQVDPKDVKVGEIVTVKPYEKIPIDGEITEGSSMINTSMLTGESIPRLVKKGDNVASGTINGDTIIKIRTTKLSDESTASKIISLIENASDRKAKSENFITSFAKVYTPVVCILALIVFLLPPIINIIFNKDAMWTVWLYRALTMLVISCPCAILVSIPLGFFAAIGGASKAGILIKGSNFIETMSNIKHIAFDKTGTMTKGVFEVVAIHHSNMDDEKLIETVAHAEFYSNHPIAKSIIRHYGKDIDKSRVSDVKEIGGHGISALIDGKNVLVGNDKLMKEYNIDYIECKTVGTIVHVAINNIYSGHIVISDIIKDDAKEAIIELKKLKLKDIIMLTGDKKSVGENVAKTLGIEQVKTEMLPDDKLKVLEEMIDNKKAKETVSFVGDGINDAPCITRADIGFAMGALGSDKAIDVADVLIMNDSPLNVAKSIKIAKKTMVITYENLCGSIGIKVLFLLLSILGLSNMWLATFADVGVLIIAILNSMRLSMVDKIK